jgi:hypothetical protein
MISNDTLYIGVDPASGNKDFTYAALDGGLNLVALDDADMEDMLAFLEQHQAVVVAVNAPAHVNRGLVRKKLEIESHKPGQIFRGVDMRRGEYELRERGITVTGTPSREEYCPAWMQVGFALYQKLSEMGFEPYGIESSNPQFMETNPYACFCVLAESIPFPKHSLEGRLQRQLMLNNKGLQITDGMTFFEEITRFKLMRGILPTEMLYTPEQLDVLVATYTAWLSVSRPDEVIKVGDVGEGQMILPTRQLQEKY